MHIYFTYSLFSSKEIIYLCQEKKVKYQHSGKTNKYTALRKWCGSSTAELATNIPVQTRVCKRRMLWAASRQGLSIPSASLATSSCICPLHRNDCHVAHTWRYSATPIWLVSCLSEMTRNNSTAPSQCLTEVLQQTSYSSTGSPAGAWGPRCDISHTISIQDIERSSNAERCSGSVQLLQQVGLNPRSPNPPLTSQHQDNC